MLSDFVPAHICDKSGHMDFSQGEGTSIKTVNIAEIVKHQFPPREYILRPVLTLGSLNMIYAWRGVGKTHVSLGIAYAAASGGTFWGWTAERPFRALYIDGEMPGEVLQARLAGIVGSSDKQPPDADYFQILTIDLHGGRMPDLATREGQNKISEPCNASELIIVDNVSCLVRGSGQENEAKSWLLAAEWALLMRSKGKCIIFVHHSGKDGNQRGTSKREDLLDVSIQLKRPFDYEIDQGARFEVAFEKARHLSGSDTATFEAWLRNDEHGAQVWTLKPLAEETVKRVADLANLDLTQREIAEELGIHKSNVCRAYQKGVDRGLIAKPSCNKKRSKIDEKKV